MSETSHEGVSDTRMGRGGGAGGSGMPFEARLRLLLALFMLLTLVVAGRLVWMQVVSHDELSRKAEANRQNVIDLHARRGTIYDRNGNDLAMSEECRTIYCNPQEVREPYLTAEVIAAHLGGSPADYVDALTADGTFSYVHRKASREEADAIREGLLSKELPGVYYLQDSRRVYPYGALGSQVLGIVGIDGEGLTGLELYYDDLLRGVDGTMVVETGNGGTPIAGAASQTTDAIDGTDLVISLDINVQRMAEEQIVRGVETYKADSGSVISPTPDGRDPRRLLDAAARRHRPVGGGGGCHGPQAGVRLLRARIDLQGADGRHRHRGGRRDSQLDVLRARQPPGGRRFRERRR